MSERLVWIVVGAITLVWVVTTLVFPFLIKGYSPPPGVSTVMGSLAGGAGALLLAKRGERNKTEDKPDVEKPKKPPRRRARSDEA